MVRQNRFSYSTISTVTEVELTFIFEYFSLITCYYKFLLKQNLTAHLESLSNLPALNKIHHFIHYHDFQLPEVSRILEAHMDVAEQRWRAGELLQFIPDNPADANESISEGNEENEATLIASHNASLSLEDTLTEENVNKMAAIVEDDSGIGNDTTLSDTVEVNKSVDEGDKTQNDDIGDVTPRNKEPQEEDLETRVTWSSPIASGSGDASYSKANEKSNECDANETVDLNDSKLYESVLSGEVDISTDDVFEDCEDDIEVTADDKKKDEGGNFDRVEQNYSLEMKLALGIEDGKL